MTRNRPWIRSLLSPRVLGVSASPRYPLTGGAKLRSCGGAGRVAVATVNTHPQPPSWAVRPQNSHSPRRPWRLDSAPSRIDSQGPGRGLMWYDIFVVAVLIVGMVRGAVRGVVWQLAGIAGIVL